MVNLLLFDCLKSQPHTGISLAALLALSQPDNQLSGLAGESDVATHRKPKLIQPLTTDNQLWAGVRALSVGQVAHCILP